MGGVHNEIVYGENVDFTGAATPTGQMTQNGQLLIGSAVSPFIRAALPASADGSVVYTFGNGTLDLSSKMEFIDQSGSFTAAINKGYFLTAISTPTLPAAPSQGDRICFVCDTASVVTVTANAGQSIRIGNTASAVAGTAASTQRGDVLQLVYRSSGAVWIAAPAPVGSWNVT